MTKKQPANPAPTVTPGLGTFDGTKVLATAVKITNAGDGLSQALTVAPRVMHRDEEVFIVLHCKVGRVAFDPIKDIEGVTRVHTLTTILGTMVDKSLVYEMIAEQQRVNDEARGISPLPFDDANAED